jgi:iron complex outermembrane recepter protein
MKQVYRLLAVSALFFFAFNWASAQGTLRGTVTSSEGEPLPGVTVSSLSSGKGTITDIEGKYALPLDQGSHQISFSYTSYERQVVPVTIGRGDATQDLVLKSSDVALGEVVISTGARSSQRTLTDSPLPVDILSSRDLKTTGQMTFDRALQYRVPSFNTVQTPVNDATSLLDPYEIRNMGPSRTLVLINGKRKNLSSLVYIQTSPGRGEGGADLSAIPNDAIQRVEILRDGASAQYGSDAIAGVMNIILKDRYNGGSLTLNTGITGKGDGEMVGLSLNNGANIGQKGFVNYTVALSHQALANRPGDVDAAGEANDFGANIADVQAFLRDRPDAGNINGDPEKAAARFCVNSGFDLSENVSVYANAAYVYKKVNSFANYRTPYWRTAGPDNFYSEQARLNGQPYVGYVPTFEGDLTDYNGTIGFRAENSGWKSDISFTTGGNQQLYTVGNSRNRSLGINSPLRFKPGGYAFRHNVGNIDVSKSLFDNLNFSIGTEFRQETFNIIAGDTSSYSGSGADSFPGIGASNESENTRYNYGGYVGLAWDISEAFLIDGTFRAEKYSDFGSTQVFKLSSRYKIFDALTVRGSYSTGFRAPMLHQIYLQIAQASFVPGQGIQTKGIFNNNSAQAAALGIAKLEPEKSQNITGGFGYSPNRNFNLTLDYYNIAVDDRIILGSEITSTDPNTQLFKVLQANGIVAASFFTNGINTRTSGLDFVANYRNVMVGGGKMGFNLAGNYMIYNKLEGAKSVSDYEGGNVTVPNGNVLNPRLVAGAGQSIFDITQEALLLSSRPKYKAILGVDWGKNKFSVNLNNTLIGPTTFRNAGMDPNLKVVFSPNIVTDLGASIEFGKNMTFNVNVNNLLNRLPQWDFKALNPAGETLLKDPAKVKNQSNLITFNQRYAIVTYDGSQFSQLGTTLSASVTVRF